MTELFSGPFRILTGMVPSWRPWLISLLSFVFFLALSPQLPAVAVTEAASRLESVSPAIDLPSIALPEGGSTFGATVPKFLAATSTPIELTIGQTDSADPVMAGDQLTFTITVTNATSTPAKKVIVVDTLDSNVTFVTSDGNCTEGPIGTLTCDLGTVPMERIFDVTVDVPADVADGTTLANHVEVSGEGIEQTPGDNTHIENTQVVAEADLSVVIFELDPPAIAGEPLTYRVTVNNAGPSEAQAVELVNSFTLPTGVDFQLSLPSGCSESADVVTCDLGTIAAGGQVQKEITLTLDPAAAKGDGISIISVVSSTTGDPESSNNTDSEDTEITTEADLSVAVTELDPPAIAGEPWTYTVTVNNAGPSDSQDVELENTFSLPAGVDFALPLPSGCSEIADVVTCVLGTVAAGAEVQKELTLDLDPATVDGVSVTIDSTVSSVPTQDPNSGNDSDIVVTEVDTDSDLSIEVTDSPDPVTVGSQLVYTVTVQNGGPSDAQNVQVTNLLTLPAEVDVNSTNGCNNDPDGSATCVLGTIAASASGSFDLTLDVGQGAADGETVTLNATASSDSNEIDSSNNSATQDTTITAEADLELTSLTSTPNTVMAGNRLVYTVKVT
ncbi:MAG: DUF11 domain-containing protein, partial [Chloroflexi bacterium]|nr:DUF11 domain-containing protein [Chloroflexota bacterium]